MDYNKSLTRLNCILFIALCILTISTRAFTNKQSQGSYRMGITRSRLFAGQTYQEMLAAARAAKQAKGNNSNPAPAVKTPPAAPAKPQAVAKVTQQKNANGLPFNDEMYDHLKFVIEKLAQRMKADKSLTSAEMKKFEASVEAILKDAGLPPLPSSSSSSSSSAPKPVVSSLPTSRPAAPTPTQTTRQVNITPKSKRTRTQYADEDEEYDLSDPNVILPAGVGPRSNEKPDPSSPYAPLHGLSNTWQIEGMDKMSTEEYYQKINERNTEMKQLRKKRGEPIGSQATESYFELLNKKTRERLAAEEEGAGNN